MANAEKLGYLLGSAKRIIAHQRELKKLRGETFNIFSILKMERRENSTHSAFIEELLNPKGSHLRGSVFLKLFLDTVGDETIDVASAQSRVEHPIGPRNDEAKTGGRIDIYIWDRNGNYISIENKIDAGDQNAQIERYCNHKKGKNNVYYLTLRGAEPTPESKGELQSGIDYYTISYKEQILDWLDKCIKEASEQPILRESIKQYKLLIQKLTSTMDKQHQQELSDLMLKHFNESAYIAANFAKVSADLREQVRQSVIGKLKSRLGNDFQIIPGNKADQQYSQIWIRLKDHENSKMFFGLESFSWQGHFNGALFIGVFNQTGKKNKYVEDNEKLSNYWINTYQLPDYNQVEVNLTKPSTLQKIYLDKKFKEGFEEHIIDEVIAYLDQYSDHLRAFLKSESLVTAN